MPGQNQKKAKKALASLRAALGKSPEEQAAAIQKFGASLNVSSKQAEEWFERLREQNESTAADARSDASRTALESALGAGDEPGGEETEESEGQEDISLTDPVLIGTGLAADSVFGAPVLILSAADDFGFRLLIELSHGHSSHIPVERRAELRAKVREFELWREENL